MHRSLPEFGVTDFQQQADIYCRYNEASDTLTHTAIRRASQALCGAVANRAELEQAIIRTMEPEQLQNRQILDQHINNGPIDLRFLATRDDEGHRFIAFTVLCTSLGNGPFTVTVVGKRWNVSMTEVRCLAARSIFASRIRSLIVFKQDEEGLTESERNGLGITDEEWYMNNPRFPQGFP